MTGIHTANKDGDIVSYIKDHHGNIVGRADYMGEMIEEQNNRMDYDAYGNQWIGDAPDPFGYCGEYYDSESGLIYLRNRYYDSAIGRFITEDPIKAGLNWYDYCSGNPVMFVDPRGLVDIPDKGSEDYNDLISTLTELIDCKINYINVSSESQSYNRDKTLERLSNEADHIRKYKISQTAPLWYSDALKQLVDDKVIDANNGGSIEEVSAVLAVAVEIRKKIIEGHTKL